MRPGVFSGMLALLALAVSLASAGWQVFAYWKSSEVRPQPFKEVVIMNEEGIAQIALEVSIANLAYGEYDDIAQDQELLIESGTHRLRFVARQTAGVRPLTLLSDGTYEAVSYPCRRAGNVIAACVDTETPVIALPAGSVTIAHPVFELAETRCGLENCGALTVQQLAGLLGDQVKVTYVVHTMRDGLHEIPCDLALAEGDTEYFVNAGWFNPRCQEPAA